jgi:hypothetical protein
MAASQWRVLSSYPREGESSMGDSLRTGSFRRDMPHAEWRLTLGQVSLTYLSIELDPTDFEFAACDDL